MSKSAVDVGGNGGLRKHLLPDQQLPSDEQDQQMFRAPLQGDADLMDSVARVAAVQIKNNN